MKKSPYATISAVCRFLGMARVDVERMIKLDGLPYLTLPGERTTVRRVPLRGLQAWLAKRSHDVPVVSYEEFAAEFHEVAGAAKADS